MFYKSLEMEVKANADKRTFEGYASKFGNLDLHNDIIEQGAFSKTIQERHPKKGIKVLWQHMEPLGIPEVLNEDDDGLYVKGRISKTRLGDEAIELMKDNVVDGMSIGYDIVKDEVNKEKGIRHLKELKLYEVSVVTWGANPEAMVTNVKQLKALNELFQDESIRTLADMKKGLDQLNERLDAGIFDTKNGNIIINADELKAGRVLSTKNRDNLSQAVELISSVLDSAQSEEPKGNNIKLTEPNDGETRDDFMTRCMNDDESIAQFPDEDERRTACQLEWDDEQDNDEDDEETGQNSLEDDGELKSLLQEIKNYARGK